MSEVDFLGARLDRDIITMVEQTAKENHVDKTKALKELIILGRKQYLLQRYLELYRKGSCSLDYAAQHIGITVAEMIDEAAKEGIQSTQSVEEYRKGLILLRKE